MIETIRLEVRVNSHHFFLIEEGVSPITGGEEGVTDIGIARSAAQRASFVVGRKDGTVNLTVCLASIDPGPRLSDYEDVVELPIELHDGVVAVHSHWGNGYLEILPPLSRGPGSYRIRYHALKMDEGEWAGYDGGIIDSYLLQIWPDNQRKASIVQVRSRYAQSMMRTVAPEG
ncbi:hypothetical protein [Actinomadura napierensis]|uniref:Uncharacterized protein n=1 Tax=Actinomadura napierensis TaxID=267854 RepID=A0ABN3ADE2_9ACTN